MTTACGPPALVYILETHTCPDFRSTYLSFFHVDLDAWGSLLSLSEMSVPYQGRKYQSGTGAEEEATDDDSEFKVQLGQFQKLGFSSAQVRAVLMKLGHHEDTNRVLEELIQAGVEREERAEPPVSTPILVCGEGTDKAPACCQSTLPSPMDLDQVADGNDGLRPIVIDGSNVAMSHGNKEVFSCRGIQLAVKYFLDRGHEDITVFVPSWRREQPRPDVPITDQHILRELEKRKILVFTPSRRVAGKRVVCYDDRFIVKLAFELDGIIVSNDTYRDLQVEKPEWKRFIEERLLMFSFVSDRFMPPDDPLGRHGPTLDNFLRKTPRVPKRQPCPYGKKCTYGIKCKFSHPERAKQTHRTLADELREKAKVSASPHRAPPSDPAPVQPTSLEDVMEQKLVLNRSRPVVKTHTSENVLMLKTRPQSSQRKFGPTRERRCNSAHISNHELLDSTHASTHGLLDSAHTSTHGHLNYIHTSTHGLQDSGLGSYECYCAEFHGGCGEHACEGELWKPQITGRHPHSLSGSQPCNSCCAVSSNTGYQHHSMSLGASQNLAAAPYCQHQYHSYGETHNYSPVSRPQYSLPTNYPCSAMPLPHGYWSEPYGRFSYSPSRPIQGESAPWGMAASKAGSLIPEREQVRKKLMAVFNARLVDRTMEMFPNLMDPQKLAVKILNLQSYEGVL